MGTRFLRHFFEPHSVAVIGASEKPHSMGGMVLGNLLEAGFPGALWAVNPRGYATVHGVSCVKRIGELPAIPDLAILCNPVEGVPRSIEALGKLGVRAALDCLFL